MYSNKNFGLTDSVLAAARQAMSHGPVPLTKVESEIAARQLAPQKSVKEARKLIGTYTHGENTSKVYKLSGEHDEGDPYHVKLFKKGKYHEPADYFTNDHDDAHGTAKSMVKEGVDKAHTVPKTAKEKSLAALATPKDKITHKDVMVGRGVVAKEEVETPTAQQVKQGIGIARDKRYAGGNMTGATKAMKKLHPDLANHPAVKKELQKQNEDFQDLDALFTEEELATIAQVADKLQNNK
jgi:hypothetical protein